MFKRLDGKEIYAPNIVLSSKFIHNVRRSGNQAEEIKITVSLDTPPEKISQLRDHLIEFLNENSRDFTTKIELNVKEILDRHAMIINMWLEHKGNWQDGAKRFMRRNKFMYALKHGVNKLDIKMANLQELKLKAFEDHVQK